MKLKKPKKPLTIDNFQWWQPNQKFSKPPKAEIRLIEQNRPDHRKNPLKSLNLFLTTWIFLFQKKPTVSMKRELLNKHLCTNSIPYIEKIQEKRFIFVVFICVRNPPQRGEKRLKFNISIYGHEIGCFLRGSKNLYFILW